MNSDPHVPMDTQLLHLERELFSLSPVETPRYLASRLDRQVLEPVGVGRQVAARAKTIPFPWRRMVVPAAAAVVAVSVLNHLDRPTQRGSGMAQSIPSYPVSVVGSVSTPVTTTKGYVLRADPTLSNPGTLQGMEQQYYIQPSNRQGSGDNTPQRLSGLAPVVFH